MWLCLTALLLGASECTLVKQDRWTVDSNDGRVVMLRGLSQVNKRPPYTHASIGFDGDDADLLAGWGFNVMRLGITWAAIEPAPGTYDQAYLASIVDTIRVLANRNINVLLDVHQDAFSTKHGGAGFPEWAALGSGHNNIGFPYIYFGGLQIAGVTIDYCVDQDFDHFWANTPLADGVGVQTRFISMLGEVARVLMSEPNVMGLEVMNEPIPGSSWWKCLSATGDFTPGCQEFESGVYSDFLEAAVGAVRAHSTKIVFFEPSGFTGIDYHVPSFVRDLHDDQLGYSFHNYYAKNYTGAFAVVDANRRSNNAVPLLTEFGDDPDVSKWDAILPLADKYLTGWMYWTYTNNPVYAFTPIAGLPADPRTQGIVLDATAALTAPNLDLNRLHTLSRPYPRATAGIPQSLDYNPTAGTFSYRYVYDPCKMGTKTTEIFIPNHAFPPNLAKYSITGKAQFQSVTALANGRVATFRNILPSTGKGLCGRQELVSISIELCVTLCSPAI